MPPPADVPIDLHLRIRVQQGRRPDFLAFLGEAIPFYEDPGGIKVQLLHDVEDDHRFIEVIHYEDESIYWQDQERVAHDPDMKRLLERWRSFLVEPPVIETYRHT